MKKILIVSPRLVVPVRSGPEARIHQFIEMLRFEGFEVSFLYINKSKRNQRKTQQYIGLDKYFFYHQKKKSISIALHKIYYWLAKNNLVHPEKLFNYPVDYYMERNLVPFFKSIVTANEYDGIILEYVFFSKLFELLPIKAAKIIDTHDRFSDMWKTTYYKNYLPKWISFTKYEEAKALNRADAVIAIQKKEAHFFKQITNTPVICLPHYMKVTPPRSERFSLAVLFIGSNYYITRQVIDNFILKALPIIVEKHLEFKLIIAGSICSALDRYKAYSNVVLYGKYNKPEDVYGLADIVINPINSGTGLKIKTVEALSFSKFLVTTSSGAEGIEEWENKAFLLEDSLIGMANKVLELIENKKLRNTLSSNLLLFQKEWRIQYEKGKIELIGILNQ